MKNKGIVFYLDDEVQILEFVKYVLEKYKYQVVTRESWDNQCLDLVKNSDIAFLDIMFPGGQPSGYEVCKIIKNNDDTKDTPVYMISAKAFDADKEKAIEVGADGFIEKPFSIEELVEIVKNATKNEA